MRSIVSSLLAVMLFFGCSAENNKSTTKGGGSKKEVTESKKAPEAKEKKIDAALGEGVFAEIATTMGTMIIQLEYEKTPLTVANFVGLAEGTKTNSVKAAGVPYYDGIIFHRIIKNFMIQGGDPKGTGTGNPGYRFPDEFDKSLSHSGPGILSMANSGPGTNGSQFFITHKATPHLNGRHTVFGKVAKGMEVVDAIANVQTGARDMPVNPVVMQSVKIHRVGEKAKAFKGDQTHFDELLKGHAERQKALMLAGAIQRAKEDEAKVKAKFPAVKLSADKAYYVIPQKEGSGETPKTGTEVKVHYTGSLLENGKVFDSSVKRGQPLPFKVGTGRVIKGWDLAVGAMKKGEKQTIILPPELAYGSRGAGGGVIPPDAWLVFEVELVDF